MKILLYVFLTMILNAYGNYPGDCDTLHWDEMIGIVEVELGECEYEVGNWDAPNYLPLDITTIPESGAGIRQFKYTSDISNLARESGRFRSFEVRGLDEDVLIAIEFGWGLTNGGDLILSIYAYVAQWNASTQSVDLVLIGNKRIAPRDNNIFVEVLWRPGIAAAGDNWIEFFCNGDSFAKKDWFYGVEVNYFQPTEVRYGSTKVILGKRPRGIYKFRVGNPAPYAFHY